MTRGYVARAADWASSPANLVRTLDGRTRARAAERAFAGR